MNGVYKEEYLKVRIFESLVFSIQQEKSTNSVRKAPLFHNVASSEQQASSESSSYLLDMFESDSTYILRDYR